MNIAATHLKPSGANFSLERLQQNSQVPESEKIAEVGRQFEALLLRKILAEVHKTVVPSKLNSGSLPTSIYQDLVTNQMADSLSRSGSLGLAKALEKQMSRQLLPAARIELAGPPAARQTPPPPLETPSKPDALANVETRKK